MDPLLSVALFWLGLVVAMSLFGFVCLKYGVYTSGDQHDKPTLEV